MNRIKYFLILFLVLLFLPIRVNAIVSPTSKFYVNDYAEVLSDEVENYILEKSVQLSNTDGTQIVVVTVPNLEGKSLEEYSIELARKWGIGDKKESKGLLLLLALEERKFRVEVGNGLEGILPDGKTGRFQDTYIIPYLKNNDFNNGIRNGYDAFLKEIVTLNNLNINYDNPKEAINDEFDFTYIAISIFMTLGFSIFIRLKKDSNKNYKPWAVLYYILLAFIVYISIMFLKLSLFYTFVVAIINILEYTNIVYGKNSGYMNGGNGSGGGFFGGSSGGGGFSGGGGSFSGGGSSRDF